MVERYIGVVGNRTGWDGNFIFAYLDGIVKEGDAIVTGGARGVDAHAMDYARRYHHKLIVYPPIEHLPSPQKYFERNKQIAQRCDILIAFDKEGHSGTSNTIRHAREQGKCILVVKQEEKDCTHLILPNIK